MDELQARKTVVAVSLVVVAVVVWESTVSQGKVIPDARTMVVLLVLITGLSIGASLYPEVFGPLTLLVGTAIAISRIPSTPGPFLKRYAGQTAPTQPPPSHKTTGQNTGIYDSGGMIV